VIAGEAADSRVTFILAGAGAQQILGIVPVVIKPREAL
jgi:hypothetical protein